MANATPLTKASKSHPTPFTARRLYTLRCGSPCTSYSGPSTQISRSFEHAAQYCWCPAQGEYPRCLLLGGFGRPQSSVSLRPLSGKQEDLVRPSPVRWLLRTLPPTSLAPTPAWQGRLQASTLVQRQLPPLLPPRPLEIPATLRSHCSS